MAEWCIRMASGQPVCPAIRPVGILISLELTSDRSDLALNRRAQPIFKHMKTIISLSTVLWTTLRLTAQAAFPVDPLDIYAETENKTILRPTVLLQLPASLLAQALADTNHAAALIESELTKHQIEVLPDGDKFLRVLPELWRGSPIAGYLSRIQPQKPNDLTNNAPLPELVPRGAINFSSVDVHGVLQIYAEYRKRTYSASLGSSLRRH